MANGEGNGGTPTGFRSLDRALNVIGAIAAVAATVWGIIVKIQVDQQNVRVEELKATISKAADRREDRKFEIEMTMRIFDEIKDIYKNENQSAETLINRLSAVSALVLAVPEQSIRERLSEAVGIALQMQVTNGATKSAQHAQAVKATFDAAIFDAASVEESVLTEVVSNKQVQEVANKSTVDAPRWGALNFNLFWCEDAENPNAAQGAAIQAQALKKLDNQARGEWRVRKLPNSVNARNGYQIHRNLIRTSSPDETAIGKVLLKTLASHGAPNFELEEVSYPSPASISVFFCGVGKPKR